MMTLNVTPELVLTRELLRIDLNNLLTHRADFLMHSTRLNYYLHSAQPSRLPALKL